MNFIAYDFSDPEKAALETLAETGRLAPYVDEFAAIAANNGGFILVKSAFQMMTKSPAAALALAGIADQLRKKMPDFSREMTAAMRSA